MDKMEKEKEGNEKKDPKWLFEHFKTFTPYQIMQQAAAALSLYEGESTDGTNPKMGRLTEELKTNTGHPAWMPERENGNLDINTEGSVFRNKARLFSSFYICVPPDLFKQDEREKQIMLTEFGKALAEGRISEKEYYDFIVKKFKFPHPAFSNYEEWVALGAEVHPLSLIIKALVYLYEKNGVTSAYLESWEIYHFLQPLKSDECTEAVNHILENRTKNHRIAYSTDDLRKINEMLAFLSID